MSKCAWIAVATPAKAEDLDKIREPWATVINAPADPPSAVQAQHRDNMQSKLDSYLEQLLMIMMYDRSNGVQVIKWGILTSPVSLKTCSASQHPQFHQSNCSPYYNKEEESS